MPKSTYRGFRVLMQAMVAGVRPDQVVVGNPPTHIMEDAAMATPFGVVMAGKDSVRQPPALTQHEVKLAFSMGEWTAQVRAASKPVLTAVTTCLKHYCTVLARMMVVEGKAASSVGILGYVQVAKLLHDLDMA